MTPEPIPLARPLTAPEIREGYEAATGAILIEAVGDRPQERPCVLVPSHGVFCWAHTPTGAVENAVTVEEVARLALLTRMIDPATRPLDGVVRDKHHERKHGPRAYYGQP